ncbi:hypothetical protein LP419_01270 [Massilia sp. H-1]|nr:hypothetical protein LP419_01270 [Massilia sp. H-1]
MIVITAVVATMMTSFIRVPVNSYVDAVRRAEESDMADHALRRIARDLRLALPNSVRVSGTSIEYLETRVGLRYLAEDDIDTPGGGSYLNWNDATQRTFTVVGGVPGGRTAPVADDYVVVYNLGPGQEPGNAYDCSATCNRAQIASLTGTTITLVSNVFAAQTTAGVALMSFGPAFPGRQHARDLALRPGHRTPDAALGLYHFRGPGRGPRGRIERAAGRERVQLRIQIHEPGQPAQRPDRHHARRAAQGRQPDHQSGAPGARGQYAMKPIRSLPARGISLITAVFLVVLLAVLAAAIVRVSSAQQANSAMDMLGSQAYQGRAAGSNGASSSNCAISPSTVTCFASPQTFAA